QWIPDANSCFAARAFAAQENKTEHRDIFQRCDFVTAFGAGGARHDQVVLRRSFLYGFICGWVLQFLAILQPLPFHHLRQAVNHLSLEATYHETKNSDESNINRWICAKHAEQRMNEIKHKRAPCKVVASSHRYIFMATRSH